MGLTSFHETTIIDRDLHLHLAQLALQPSNTLLCCPCLWLRIYHPLLDGLSNCIICPHLGPVAPKTRSSADRWNPFTQTSKTSACLTKPSGFLADSTISLRIALMAVSSFVF